MCTPDTRNWYQNARHVSKVTGGRNLGRELGSCAMGLRNDQLADGSVRMLFRNPSRYNCAVTANWWYLTNDLTKNKKAQLTQREHATAVHV